MRFGIIGLDPQRRLQDPDGLGEAVEVGKGDCEIVQHLGGGRLERQRAPVRGLRSLMAPQLVQGIAEVVVQLRGAGLERHGAPEELDRLGGAAQRQQGAAEIIERFGVVGLQPDRLEQRLPRLLVAAQSKQQDRKILQARRIAGVGLEGGTVACFGLDEPAGAVMRNRGMMLDFGSGALPVFVSRRCARRCWRLRDRSHLSNFTIGRP